MGREWYLPCEERAWHRGNREVLHSSGTGMTSVAEGVTAEESEIKKKGERNCMICKQINGSSFESKMDRWVLRNLS